MLARPEREGQGKKPRLPAPSSLGAKILWDANQRMPSRRTRARTKSERAASARGLGVEGTPALGRPSANGERPKPSSPRPQSATPPGPSAYRLRPEDAVGLTAP